MIRKSKFLYLTSGIILITAGGLVVTTSLTAAGYTSILKDDYQVTFKNYDDTILQISDVKKGENAVYEGKTPTRESDDDYYYVFIGWDHSLFDVQYSFTTYAQFDKITNEGTGNGTEIGNGDNGGNSSSEGGNEESNNQTTPTDDIIGGGGEGTGSGSGDEGTGGGGGSGGGGGGGSSESESEPTYNTLQIKTLSEEDIYLRNYSYGSVYDGPNNVWSSPEESGHTYNLNIEIPNPLFFASARIVKSSGARNETVSLHYPTLSTYPIPQYPHNFVSLKGSDAQYQTDRYIPAGSAISDESQYIISLYDFNIGSIADLTSLKIDSDIAREEVTYQQYVKEAYLDVDKTVYSWIFNALEKEGITSSLDKENLILKTADFVRNYGFYNDSFSHASYTPREDKGDYLLNLEEDKIATKETFANMCTLALRGLSVPARTVKGYKVNTNGKENYVDVTDDDIYYWTEFYIDEVGWIYIDPIPEQKTISGTPESQTIPSGSDTGEGKVDFDSGIDTIEGETGDEGTEVSSLLEISASKAGSYYLRSTSYVNYLNNKWNNYNYSGPSTITINPIYYATDKMLSSDLEAVNLNIDYKMEFVNYPVPEYDKTYVNKYYDDNSVYYQPINNQYKTSAYQVEGYYKTIEKLKPLTSVRVSEDELKSYSDFVHKNYLNVDKSLS